MFTKYTEVKDGQWLGVSVDSNTHGDGKIIVRTFTIVFFSLLYFLNKCTHIHLSISEVPSIQRALHE